MRFQKTGKTIEKLESDMWEWYLTWRSLGYQVGIHKSPTSSNMKKRVA